jgi:hypothetical protein
MHFEKNSKIFKTLNLMQCNQILNIKSDKMTFILLIFFKIFFIKFQIYFQSKLKKMVKCIFSTCALSQNQIAILVFKNITNGTYSYQINPLGTSVRIPLVFLTEYHITLTHGVVPVVSRCHVAWHLSFWMPCQIK